MLSAAALVQRQQIAALLCIEILGRGNLGIIWLIGSNLRTEISKMIQTKEPIRSLIEIGCRAPRENSPGRRDAEVV
jgi:hypothetical protein